MQLYKYFRKKEDEIFPFTRQKVGKYVIERRLDESVPLKSRAEHRICGRDALRADAADKVTGRARFAGDIRLSGMLYARILRPPVHGARLDDVNTAAAEAIDGVRVVRDDDLIAVVHEHPDVAAISFVGSTPVAIAVSRSMLTPEPMPMVWTVTLLRAASLA